MISVSYKEGVNKNGKAYMLCYLDFTGKDGRTHRERFFVKPWNTKALAECIEDDGKLEKEVKAIYG